MDYWKHTSFGGASSLSKATLNFPNTVQDMAQLVQQDIVASQAVETDVNIDFREVYFLIMHFLSSGPCQKTLGHFWNELLEHQLLPRRYHAWFSRSGVHSGNDNDDGISFPLSYNKLVERYRFVFFYFNFCFKSDNKFRITVWKLMVMCSGFSTSFLGLSDVMEFSCYS